MKNARPRIGIIGAGGFLGTRLIESWFLGGHIHPVAIVRRPASLARLARFPVEQKIADAADPKSLADAIRNCDGLVHATVGQPREIIQSARSLVEAVRLAGVPRTVYLSSALVHGPHPERDFDESAPLALRQSSEYGRAKIKAEQILVGGGLSQLVRLRPGIVYGPRSRWIVEPVAALRAGSFGILNNGKGICPAIYVDNLIHAIECAIDCENADGHAFLVRDSESLTWNEFYQPILRALDYTSNAIRDGVMAPSPPWWQQRAEALRVHPQSQQLLAHVPNHWKQAAKGALQGFGQRSRPAPQVHSERTTILPTELAELQQNRSTFSNHRAREIMGYSPSIKFADGMARSLAWLKFTGATRAESVISS